MSHPLELARALGLSQAASLREQMVAMLEGDAPLVLDGGEVESVDTSCLQLLAALFRDAEAQQRAITWHAASNELKVAARRLGLLQRIGLGER